MKKYNSLYIIKLSIIIFLLITLFLSLGIPNQSSNKLIVLNIAVDQIEEEYEVSFQYLIPEYGTSFSEKTDIISAKGTSIALAIENIEAKVGKSSGLAHTNALIVSDESSQDNVFEILDYFIRHRSLGNYTVLINTDKKAKDLLTISALPHNSNLNSLANITIYNSEINLTKFSTIHTFLKGYYSKSKTSKIIRLSYDEENTNSTSTGSSSSGGEQNSNSNQNQGTSSENSGNSSGKVEEKKFIKNVGDSVIFVDGKKVKTLNRTENQGFNWLDSDFKMSKIEINNVSDENFTNANIVLEVGKDSINRNISFNNNIPIIKFDLKLNLKLVSIYDKNKQISLYKNNSNYISEVVINKLKTLIIESVNNSILLSKRYNFDLLSLYDTFEKYKTKEWIDYINILDNKEMYIQQIEVFTEINTNLI